jgi:RimK family alpha-L-glutamate ligase
LGASCDLVDAATVSAQVADDGLALLGLGTGAGHSDAVIARVGNWRPESMLAALECLVGCGASTPNPPQAIRLGRDHWATAATLSRAGIPIPRGLAGVDPERLAADAVEHLGMPVVVKQRRSRMGIGVIRCDSRDHLEAVLDSLWRVGDEIVIQQWLTGGEHSHRLLVVGGAVVAAARFSAADGEWRSNSARGGLAEAYQPSPEENALAAAAAEALGLGHCGVDVVGAGRPTVLEVNPTPGFLRLEEVTGVDVARALVEHALSG